MNSYGVVLRKLRVINKEQMKVAAKRVGRSVGWLCEVENQTGKARITEEEFRRILSLYGGDKYSEKDFALWIANAARAKPRNEEVSFDGAILKYLRFKRQMTLKEAGLAIGVTKSCMAKTEVGACKVTVERRNQLLKVYGYSPSSYKNFYSRNKRALNVPALFKLDILLRGFDEKKRLEVFDFAMKLNTGMPQTEIQSAEKIQESDLKNQTSTKV